MTTLFASPDPLLVKSLQALLGSRGITATVLREHLQSGAGALPPSECWLELVLEDSSQEVEAKRIVAAFLRPVPGLDGLWECPICGEKLPAQFTDCWKNHELRAEQRSDLNDEERRLCRYIRTLILVRLAVPVADQIFVRFHPHGRSGPVWGIQGVPVIFDTMMLLTLLGIFFLRPSAKTILLFLCIFELFASSVSGTLLPGTYGWGFDLVATLLTWGIVWIAFATPLKEKFVALP